MHQLRIAGVLGSAFCLPGHLEDQGSRMGVYICLSCVTRRKIVASRLVEMADWITCTLLAWHVGPKCIW